MAVSRDRVRHIEDIAIVIGYHEGSVASRLVFSGPEVLCAGPGPARPERPVYQGDRTPGSLGRLPGGGPELLHCVADDRGQELYVAGDAALADAAYLGPHFPGYSIPHVPPPYHDP